MKTPAPATVESDPADPVDPSATGKVPATEDEAPAAAHLASDGAAESPAALDNAGDDKAAAAADEEVAADEEAGAAAQESVADPVAARPVGSKPTGSGDLQWLERAELSLALAARARVADPALARELLSRTVESVARSFAAPSERAIELDLDGSVALLDRLGVLAKAGDAAKQLAEDLRGDGVDPSKVEPIVAKLVAAARRRRARSLSRILGLVAFALVLVAGIGVALGNGYWRPWRGYTFRASSAYTGYRNTGKLGESSERSLLFHTKEESQPWVEIDLLEAKSIHSVTLQNRMECCSDRAVPLVVEVAPGPKKWREVARRDEDFQSWEAKFDPTTVRYVRVRSLKKTILHLRAVEVR